MPARSAPSAATTPITRPVIGPGVVTIWDSAGEGTGSAAGDPFGAGRPSPAATDVHRFVSTLASTPSIRSRIGCS